MRLVVTKDDYFATALDVLATSGHRALKIGSLCKSIGVTTGFFYHYFGSWGGFVDERRELSRLLDEYEALILREASLPVG